MIPTNRRLLRSGEAPGPLLQPGVHMHNATAADAPSLLQSNPSSMAFTAFIILVALFFLGSFAIVARRFFSGIHVADAPHRRPPATSPPRRFRGSSWPAAAARGLDPAAVRQLPVLSYVGGGGKEGCVVCLADFQDKEKVKLIPGCGHVFHPQCIDAWLMSKWSCPICRCSELFGSTGAGRGAVRLDLVVGDGGEEFGVDVEVGAGRGGEEEVRGRGGEGEKVLELGRSSSSSGLWVQGERVVFLRRTCSF
ncbi:RING-H2 finger protein ATL57-like [Phoenix dactylifera]|uniref:RING-type E3 ubiquitin transferase n=1 Tax=Phoenix dactylifera TaxID=42345 RepID=A0A8B7MUG3_PHODC|nr:RING-H2 finger protein ATL57-like [Phoenix dactylifera]